MIKLFQLEKGMSFQKSSIRKLCYSDDHNGDIQTLNREIRAGPLSTFRVFLIDFFLETTVFTDLVKVIFSPKQSICYVYSIYEQRGEGSHKSQFFEVPKEWFQKQIFIRFLKYGREKFSENGKPIFELIQIISFYIVLL